MVSRPLSAPNHATLALWAPGSLFKPLTVALALEGGYVTPDEVFDLSSPHVFHTPSVRKSRPVHDSHPIGAGAIDDILVHSSNIGVSLLLWRLIHGPGWAASDAVPSYDRALAFLRAVGLYGPTGLELADDVHRPFLSEDHPNVLYPAIGWAFGKGVGTSPLKTLCAFAALARDDGRVVRPTLLAGRGGGRRDLEPIVPTAAHRHVVREALRGVVQRGTARRAFEGCTLDVAAKTGTAVFEGTTKQIAGLIALAPVERPRLAVLVMCNVDETTRHPDHGPHQQPSGGVVAGPPARAILERTFAYLDGRALAEAREALR